MRYEDNPTPTLTVSRRNLLALLTKLDINRDAGRQVSAVMIGDPDGVIYLHAEEDDVHYDPERRAALGHAPVPGIMVRSAEDQTPLTAEGRDCTQRCGPTFHAIDPKQGGDGFSGGKETDLGPLMNPDGAW